MSPTSKQAFLRASMFVLSFVNGALATNGYHSGHWWVFAMHAVLGAGLPLVVVAQWMKWDRYRDRMISKLFDLADPKRRPPPTIEPPRDWRRFSEATKQ